MKLQRFLVENMVFQGDEIILSEKNLLNQILNVFRMRRGFQLIIFDGSGTEFLVEIEDFDKKEIICRIVEERYGLLRKKRLNLVFAMLKKENIELVLQKCTEIGVTSFTPLITERTVKTGWNFERMEKILAEAVEQSGFSDLPVLATEPQKLEKVLEKLQKEKENLDGLCVLDERGVQLSSLKHLISVDTIFVGPEGGWSDKEINLFKKFNVKNISLGANTLRAETACISAAAIFLL